MVPLLRLTLFRLGVHLPQSLCLQNVGRPTLDSSSDSLVSLEGSRPWDTVTPCAERPGTPRSNRWDSESLSACVLGSLSLCLYFPFIVQERIIISPSSQGAGMSLVSLEHPAQVLASQRCSRYTCSLRFAFSAFLLWLSTYCPRGSSGPKKTTEGQKSDFYPRFMDDWL